MCDGEAFISCDQGKITNLHICPAGCSDAAVDPCQPPPGTCTYGATCDGAVLTSCAGSEAVTVDCKALGFSGCDPSYYGRCVP